MDHHNPILMKWYEMFPYHQPSFLCTAQVTGRSDVQSGRLGTWWKSQRVWAVFLSSQYHSARSWPHFPQFHLLGLGCWVLSQGLISPGFVNADWLVVSQGLISHGFVRGLEMIFWKIWREKRVENKLLRMRPIWRSTARQMLAYGKTFVSAVDD